MNDKIKQWLSEMFSVLSRLLPLVKKQEAIDNVPITLHDNMVIIPKIEQPAEPQPIPMPTEHSHAWRGGTLDERKNMYALAQRICVEKKLSTQLTREMLATIHGESGYNQWCVNINKDGSGDYGVAQLNTKWYLTPYKMTPQDAMNDPERCLRIMAAAFNAGRADDWIAHRNGAYEIYLDKPVA